MKEWVKFASLAAAFGIFYFAPIDAPIVLQSIGAGLELLHEYSRDHVLTCLVPAFFIAGTIAVYVKKDAVMQLLGPTTKKYIAYPVASVSGGILAVCSCTILPLFTGIYKRGAGIGPAVAFLFTGPAINVTAILLTSSVLGWDFAVGRLVSAVIISVIAGLFMAVLFRDHDRKNVNGTFAAALGGDVSYSNATITLFFLLQLTVLVVFGLSIDPMVKAAIIIALIAVLLGIVFFKFQKEHNLEWLRETWDLTKKILPYLFVGVFIAGIIEVVLPQEFVTDLVGRNTLLSNVVASTFGAFMYFATLTEVPIIQKLMDLGMGRGPALTLFLTGNALSLPSMIVLFKVMGKKQAPAYILTIMVLSVIAGWLFGEVL
ncbi:MAG: permease [Ignavibacteriae bacterium]|nr:permease [Ignavibacteriota bacterium]